MVVLRALHEVAWNYRREVDNRYAHKGQRDRGTRGQVQVVQMKNECPACIYAYSCIYRFDLLYK